MESQSPVWFITVRKTVTCRTPAVEAPWVLILQEPLAPLALVWLRELLGVLTLLTLSQVGAQLAAS